MHRLAFSPARLQALLLCSLIATVAAIALRPATAEAEPTPAEFFGLIGRSDLGNPAEAPEAAQLGVYRVRVAFDWSVASTSSNCTTFNSGYYDSVVLAAAEHGITIYPVLAGNCVPEGGGYATSAFPTVSTATNYSTWLSFVTSLVRRYGKGGEFWTEHPGVTARPITVWEVWNEENLAVNNPNPLSSSEASWQVFPEKYARFLIDTSAAIKSVIPGIGATVLVGGLAPGGWRSPGPAEEAPSTKSFLDAMYENAPASGPETYTSNELYGSYDGVAIHPYALNGSATQAEEKVEEARTALNTDKSPGLEDRNKPLAVSELGWPVKDPEWSGITTGVGEVEQAENIHDAFSWLRSHAESLNVLYAGLYLNQDRQDSTPGWDDHAGLRWSNGEPRSSLCAFSELTGANLCSYVKGGYPTETFATLALVVNGKPGLVTITGNVYLKGSPAGVSIWRPHHVNVKFWKKEEGAWQEKEPSYANLVNGHYEVANRAVGQGEWKTQTVFPQQAEHSAFLRSSSNTHSFQIAEGSSNAYEAALQTNTGGLVSIGPGTGTVWGQAMASGTSPSIARLTNGTRVIAFQTSGGELASVTSSGAHYWGQGMASGTSPSVAALTNGSYVIAFQTNTGQLATIGPGGATYWGQGMASGTSPSIAGLTNGSYEVAFQANTGTLISIGPGNGTNWGQGMASGTSPGIAAMPGGKYVMAFQANTGTLISIGPGIAVNWGQGLASGTSPSVAELTNGKYVMAFQANTGQLISIGPSIAVNWGQGLASGTSPSIAALSSGNYVMAFQANTGQLVTIGPGIAVNWAQGMAGGTSPGVSGG